MTVVTESRRAALRHLQSLGLFLQPLPEPFFRVMRWKLSKPLEGHEDIHTPHPWREARGDYEVEMKEKYNVKPEFFDDLLDNPEKTVRPTAKMIKDWDKKDWVELHMSLMDVCSNNVSGESLLEYIADTPKIQGYALVRPTSDSTKSYEMVGLALWTIASPENLRNFYKRQARINSGLQKSLDAGRTAEILVVCTRGGLDAADLEEQKFDNNSPLERAKKMSQYFRSLTPVGAGTGLLMYTLVDIWSRKSRRAPRYDRVLLDAVPDFPLDEGIKERAYRDQMAKMHSVKLYTSLGFRTAKDLHKKGRSKSMHYFMELELPGHSGRGLRATFDAVQQKHGLVRFGKFCDQTNPKCP